MLHPSYSDLMKVVNSEVEPGEEKIVNSRYSIVMATAKRARQLSDGAKPLTNKIEDSDVTLAADEIAEGKVGIKE